MRLPLRMPTGRVSPTTFDTLLSEGDRRSGPVFYRPSCPGCTACEALRVHVPRFTPTRSQRRAWTKNNTTLRVERRRPAVTPRHLELYDRHAHERGLALHEGPTTEQEYQSFLVNTCVDTWEIQYLSGNKLIAVSLVDLGRNAMSSVYHFFDPDESWRSLGVYSVLKEIELCAALNIEWYYLGLYVSECDHLNYKSQYFPHQRRIRGVWYETSSQNSPLVRVSP